MHEDDKKWLQSIYKIVILFIYFLSFEPDNNTKLQ